MRTQRRRTPGPDVRVLGWSDRHAVGEVDGILVRVRRTKSGARWRCEQCGTQTQPHCTHTRALAAAPAREATRTRRPTRTTQ